MAALEGRTAVLEAKVGGLLNNALGMEGRLQAVEAAAAGQS